VGVCEEGLRARKGGRCFEIERGGKRKTKRGRVVRLLRTKLGDGGKRRGKASSLFSSSLNINFNEG